MKKCLWLLGLLFFTRFAAIAQFDSLGQRLPLVTIKADLLNLINPHDPSVLGTLEYFLVPGRFSVSHEVGFVTEIRSETDIDIAKSFKLGHEARLYLPLIFNSPQVVFYVSGEFQFRRLVVNETYVLGYECDQGCVYYRNFDRDFSTIRRTWQIHSGIQGNLTPKLLFDLDLGLGQSEFSLDREELNGGTFLEHNRFLNEDAFTSMPYLTISGKLGYRLISLKSKGKQ